MVIGILYFKRWLVYRRGCGFVVVGSDDDIRDFCLNG